MAKTIRKPFPKQASTVKGNSDVAITPGKPSYSTGNLPNATPQNLKATKGKNGLIGYLKKKKMGIAS